MPVTASANSPYIVVGHGFTEPHQAGAPDSACTSCHRAQCDTNFAVPLGELVMPAPFAGSTPRAEHSGDRRELRDWCESLPSRGEGGGGEEEE